MELLDISGKASVSAKEVIGISKAYDDQIYPQGNPKDGRYFLMIHLRSQAGNNFFAVRFITEAELETAYQKAAEELCKLSEF